jgi:murein DD-endopeptidase MepM/ murein hydrolase activator NlpD
MQLDPAIADRDDDAGELPVLRRVRSETDPSASPLGADPDSHPIRDRLLARAAEARKQAALPEQADSKEEEAFASVGEELERVASRGPPRAAQDIPRRRRDLSPNVVMLFGILLGLTLFAALFAILVHLDPRDHAGLVAIRTPEPTARPESSAPPATSRKPIRKHVPGPWRISDANEASLKKVQGTIGYQPFLKAVEEAGVPHAQTFRLLKAFSGVRDFDHCFRSDQFAALIDKASGRVTAFEYMAGKEDVYQAREGSDGLLKAAKLDLKVERARVQGALVMDKASFAQAADAAGFEAALASVLDDALEGHASVADFRRGDRLRVVAQEVTVLGDFARYAGIEALEYVRARGDAKPLRVYYFRGSKSHGYYDADGRAVHEGGWRKPIKGAPITSHFNPKRMHPILHKIMPHQGTDFGAPMGTPVGAAGPGVVHSIGYEGPAGNLVTLDHSGGIQTGYAHLSRFEPGLKVGDHVTAMQLVGYVGSTGRSTGPHLHFSAKRNGVFFDAETLRLDSLRTLPMDERAEFATIRAKYDALIDAIALPAALEEAPQPAPSAEEPSESPEDEMGAVDPNAEPPEVAAAPAVAPLSNEPPASSAAPAAPPVDPKKGSSIYLSDQDLLRSQSATDDGEVEQ